jgi:hypothetical protein
MQITEKKEKRYAREKGKEEREARDKIKKDTHQQFEGTFFLVA